MLSCMHIAYDRTKPLDPWWWWCHQICPKGLHLCYSFNQNKLNLCLVLMTNELQTNFSKIKWQLRFHSPAFCTKKHQSRCRRNKKPTQGCWKLLLLSGAQQQYSNTVNIQKLSQKCSSYTLWTQNMEIFLPQASISNRRGIQSSLAAEHWLLSAC